MKRKYHDLAHAMVARPGFEPGQTDSKSVVLPLHNPAPISTRRIIAWALPCCNALLRAGPGENNGCAIFFLLVHKAY